MDSLTIRQKIDALFTNQDRVSSEEIRALQAVIQENYRRAVEQTKKGTAAFIVSWVTFCAISIGVVSGGTFGSITIGQVKSLLLAAPILLGWLFYYTTLSLTAAGYLRAAMTQIFKYSFPEAHSLGLDRLLLTPTMFGTEYYMRQQSSLRWLNRVSSFWLISLRIGIVLGGALLFVHGTAAMWFDAPFNGSWLTLVTVVGSVCWIRGFLLLVTLIEQVAGEQAPTRATVRS